MRQLSRRESRILAVALLLASVSLADVVLVQPVFDGFSARAQARQVLLARHAANDRLIAAIPRLGREAALRDRQLASYALSAPDAATAADNLRDRLEAATTAVGGDFHGGEDLPGSGGASGANRIVATRVILRLSAGQLTQFLARVQNTRPFIIINALAVRADDTLVTGKATTLDVNLEAAIAYRPARAR